MFFLILSYEGKKRPKGFQDAKKLWRTRWCGLLVSKNCNRELSEVQSFKDHSKSVQISRNFLYLFSSDLCTFYRNVHSSVAVASGAMRSSKKIQQWECHRTNTIVKLLEKMVSVPRLFVGTYLIQVEFLYFS